MKRKNVLGLTLIEFIVAFAIFSTIALSIYATLFSGLKISKKAENFDQFFHNIYWSLNTIQLDLENMVPFQFANQDPPVTAFWGNANEFSLILSSDSGLKRIHYFLKDPKEAHIHTVQIGIHSSKNVAIKTSHTSNNKSLSYLIRQEQDWGKTPEDEILNTQILKGSFKISYAHKEKNTLVWENQWKDSSFPASIRLQMTFLDPDNPAHDFSVQKTIIIPLGIWGKIKQ